MEERILRPPSSGKTRTHTHTHTQVYTFTVSFLSQNLDRRLGNFINYEGNGERPG